MKSNLKIEDIQIGKEYGYWVYMGTNINNYADTDLVCGKCVKKGEKKVGIFISAWKKIKWKYPNELTKCF